MTTDVDLAGRMKDELTMITAGTPWSVTRGVN
jgi:hypothetical protein